MSPTVSTVTFVITFALILDYGYTAYKATCPSSIPNCSERNSCIRTSCHSTCEYCQCKCSSSKKQCSADDCMTCHNPTDIIDVKYDDETGYCVHSPSLNPTQFPISTPDPSSSPSLIPSLEPTQLHSITTTETSDIPTVASTSSAPITTSARYQFTTTISLPSTVNTMHKRGSESPLVIDWKYIVSGSSILSMCLFGLIIYKIMKYRNNVNYVIGKENMNISVQEMNVVPVVDVMCSEGVIGTECDTKGKNVILKDTKHGEESNSDDDLWDVGSDIKGKTVGGVGEDTEFISHFLKRSRVSSI